MKSIFVFILFLTFNAFADCKMSNGKTFVTVPENKVVSLFDPGKSLSTHKTQDQDGLGTCYANTTTAVLKSVLPGNPNVSYLHAALSSSTNGWSQNWSKGNNSYVKKDAAGAVSDFTYGGFFCETIGALKKSGGACPVNHSILENKQLVNSDVQAEMMNNLGIYFDSLNQVKNDPTKLQKLKQNLAKVVDSVNLERSKVIQACVAERNKELPIKKALDEAVSMEIINIDFNDPCGKSKAEKFQSMLGAQSIVSEDKIKIVIPPNLENEFNLFLAKNTELKTNLLKNLKGNSAQAREDKVFQSQVGRKISEFLDAKLATIGVKNATCPQNSLKNKIQSTPEELGSSFYSGILNQKSDVCDAYVENSAIMEAVKHSNVNQCVPENQLDIMINALAPIMKIGEALDQSLVNKLSNPLSQYGKQLKDLLLPGCSDKNNLIDMKNIACSSFSMCDQSQYIDMSNNTYTGPQGGCYDIGSARSIVRTKVLNNITAGKALGISVCTAFMNNPNARTNFCQTPVQGIAGHSFHEMTISGYRCKGGKVEYQLLNSWGKESGCPVNEGNKNSAIECSLDGSGNRDGKFWVKEDVLVDSTNEISQLSKLGQ